MTTYKFSTPDHDYTLVPNPTVPDLIEIRSEYREAVEEVIETLELAGVAEGEDFSTLTIEEDMTNQEPFFYTEVSKATLTLWLQFEVLNYMGISALAL